MNFVLVHFRLGKERWDFSWCTLSHRAELLWMPNNSLPAHGLWWEYDSNERKNLTANYSTKRQEGDAVSEFTMLSCGNTAQQQQLPTLKAGGGEKLSHHRACGGKRRYTHTSALHHQCPAVTAAVRQQKPVPIRNGIWFQYRKKPINTKNNLLHTVYLNQQSNIHWDVLHANALGHSTIKNIFIYTHI